MKVRKVFGTETTDYLDGFQYTDSVLKFFLTAEGYFNVETGKYVYNYTDHLGNTRLSYAKSGAGTEIIEESNYYPFGLKHEGYNLLAGNPVYKYKYQGQELQENGWYSFKWRNYMPDLGRFFNIDPLSEKFQYNSIYAFQENKMGLGKELEGAELLQERGLITSIGMTEYDVYTKEQLPDYMSYLNYKPSTPDPELMTAEEYPTNSAAKGAENSSSFKGVIGIVELYNVVNKGIEGVKGMVATDKNVKAVNYMDKLTGEFKDMKTALSVVNKADLKLDNKTKTEITNYIFDGSFPKDINKRNNSVVSLQSKTNIVNTANTIMRKNGIIVRNGPEVKKRTELNEAARQQKEKLKKVGQ